MAGLVELVVALANLGGGSGGGLTAIRLLRLFRLARYWTGLSVVLKILVGAGPGLGLGLTWLDAFF